MKSHWLHLFELLENSLQGDKEKGSLGNVAEPQNLFTTFVVENPYFRHTLTIPPFDWPVTKVNIPLKISRHTFDAIFESPAICSTFNGVCVTRHERFS